MTLQERIADWISGGALSLHKENSKFRLRRWMEEEAEHTKTLNDARKIIRAVQSIAACETPGANATVRRMARIAREALE